MLEWLFANAKQYTDVIVFLGASGGAATWIWRMLIQSKKNIDALVTSIADIKKQLVANGGTSLFDVVKETSVSVKKLSSDLSKVKAWQWSFSQASRMPMWESDAAGSCMRINIALGDLVGRTAEQMAGAGWENIMPPGPERAEVWASWNDAIQRKRTFEHTYTVEHSATGKKHRVKAVATPVITDGELLGFIGRYEEVTPL